MIIGSKESEQIIIKDLEDNVIAVISDNEIICNKGYEVIIE